MTSGNVKLFKLESESGVTYQVPLWNSPCKGRKWGSFSQQRSLATGTFWDGVLRERIWPLFEVGSLWPLDMFIACWLHVEFEQLWPLGTLLELSLLFLFLLRWTSHNKINHFKVNNSFSTLHSGQLAPLISCKNSYFLTLYFDRIFNLGRSYKNGTRNSCIIFTQIQL